MACSGLTLSALDSVRDVIRLNETDIYVIGVKWDGTRYRPSILKSENNGSSFNAVDSSNEPLYYAIREHIDMYLDTSGIIHIGWMTYATNPHLCYTTFDTSTDTWNGTVDDIWTCYETRTDWNYRPSLRLKCDANDKPFIFFRDKDSGNSYDIVRMTSKDTNWSTPSQVSHMTSLSDIPVYDFIFEGSEIHAMYGNFDSTVTAYIYYRHYTGSAWDTQETVYSWSDTWAPDLGYLGSEIMMPDSGYLYIWTQKSSNAHICAKRTGTNTWIYSANLSPGFENQHRGKVRGYLDPEDEQFFVRGLNMSTWEFYVYQYDFTDLVSNNSTVAGSSIGTVSTVNQYCDVILAQVNSITPVWSQYGKNNFDIVMFNNATDRTYYFLNYFDWGIVVSPAAIDFGLASVAPTVQWANAIGRPWGDTSLDGWTDEVAGTVDIYKSIYEVAKDNNDYVQSPTALNNEIYKVKLSDIGGITIDQSNVKLYYTYKKSLATDTVNLKVRLIENTTTIVEYTHTDIPNTWTDQEQTLTLGQASSITDWTDLYLEFEAYST